MRYAIVEGYLVVNIIESDGPLRGLEMVPDDGTARIGGRWDGATFTPPELSAVEHNAPILAMLDLIDAKSIRALREGDATRIAALEAEAATLRATLRKD